MLRKQIRYALVHLSHPTIEKLFTESNVLYGVESNLNVCIPHSQVVNFDIDILYGVENDSKRFEPRSQVVNWDCDIRCTCD